VAADNPKHLQGGTQDNGTFETYGSATTWPQVIYGDGGQSGFNVGNSALRFNSFTNNAQDVNFQNGDPLKWVIATGPIRASGESALFYSPMIADPVTAGTIFEGSLSVWRTQDWAGNQAFLDANCPGRFISGIVIDPANSNHAWISYSSYSTLTPAQPGHIFSVTYDPSGPTATWTNLDGSSFPDFPATSIAFDSVKGDVYASNDWGVLVLPNRSNTWLVAGTGLPNVEVAGRTIVPSAREIYAATHGRSAWQLTLP